MVRIVKAAFVGASAICAFFLSGCNKEHDHGKLCDSADGHMIVGWHDMANAADYDDYELQIWHNDDFLAVYRTSGTEAHLTDLLPNHTYSFRVRGHLKNATNRNRNFTKSTAATVTCNTSALEQNTPSLHSNNRSVFVEVIRMTEGSHRTFSGYDVDYLSNHASGDLMAGAHWMATIQNQNWVPWSGVESKRDTTWTTYCVELLNVNLTETVQQYHDEHFADYMSCNNDGHDICRCRTEWDAHAANDTDLQCPNSQAWNNSQTYVGRQVQYFVNGDNSWPALQEPQGHWYSHPAATECVHEMKVGDIMENGKQCTWKVHPLARVTKGGRLLDGGLRFSKEPVPMNVTQHNVKVIRDIHASDPLKPWSSCGVELPDSSEVSTNSLIVV